MAMAWRFYTDIQTSDAFFPTILFFLPRVLSFHHSHYVKLIICPTTLIDKLLSTVSRNHLAPLLSLLFLFFWLQDICEFHVRSGPSLAATLA